MTQKPTADFPVFAFVLMLVSSFAAIILGVIITVYHSDSEIGMMISAIGATFGFCVLLIIGFASNAVIILKSWW